jgi:undecaprenyl-diphosphatase
MWLEVVVLSIVEGVTEFLPVSSTGHMILAKALMGLPESDALNAFLVIVQAGGILAVVSLFWPLFLKWIQAWLALRPRHFQNAQQSPIKVVFQETDDAGAFRRQSMAFALSVVPFAICGFLFGKTIKTFFHPNVVSWALICGGVFILLAEHFLKNRTDDKAVKDYSFKDALWVGVGQCLALWPGFSRAAATLLFGRFAGYSRTASAEISFLVGFPTLLGVAGYEAMKEWKHLTSEWLLYVGVGIAIAWVVAYFCVKTFVAFLKKYPLSVFAWYRIGVGILMLIYFNLRV